MAREALERKISKETLANMGTAITERSLVITLFALYSLFINYIMEF